MISKVINLIKRLFCNHDFKLVATYKRDIDKTVGYELKEIYIIYCPKCKKEKEVLRHDYDRICEKQKYDEEYRNKKEIRKTKKEKRRLERKRNRSGQN